MKLVTVQKLTSTTQEGFNINKKLKIHRKICKQFSESFEFVWHLSAFIISNNITAIMIMEVCLTLQNLLCKLLNPWKRFALRIYFFYFNAHFEFTEIFLFCFCWIWFCLKNPKIIISFGKVTCQNIDWCWQKFWLYLTFGY